MRITNRPLLLLLMFALVTCPLLAAAQEGGRTLQVRNLALSESPPSSGNGQIIAGWIASGWGALNLALLPVCYAEFYPQKGKGICIGLSIGFAAVGLGVGIPLLAIGYHKHSNYDEWRRSHGLSALLLKLRLVPMRDGGALVYRAAF